MRVRLSRARRLGRIQPPETTVNNESHTLELGCLGGAKFDKLNLRNKRTWLRILNSRAWDATFKDNNAPNERFKIARGKP